MTEQELATLALREAKAAAYTWPEFLREVKAGRYTDAQLRATHWYRAGDALDRAKTVKPSPPPAPPPAPPKSSSPFAGVGIFASEQPLAAAGLAVDWVAVAAYYATPQIVAGLKQAGKRVFAWDELGGPPVEGPGAVARLGADGYVWTVESQAQFAATPVNAPEPRAIVCNTEAMPFPSGWHCIAEGYSLINPPQTADQMVRDMRARGATEISVCVLPADSGKRVPLAWYDAQLGLAVEEGAVGVSVFRVETLGPGDAEHLAAFRELLAEGA